MNPPIPVLSISGHDPTGGAGIQADIQAILSQGCYPCTVITCLTSQDTGDVRHIYPQPPDVFSEQLEVLLADIPVRAIKIGLLGSAAIAQCVATVLENLSTEIVVLDPVLRSGGGNSLADQKLIEVIRSELLPLTTIVTPNHHEARLLGENTDTAVAIERMMSTGCQAVLLTGGDEATPLVYNTLYSGKNVKTFSWERLPHGAHGSGCTLASSMTALLALGLPLEEATRKAQQYTWNAIKYGFRPGRGQPIPYHLFWN